MKAVLLAALLLWQGVPANEISRGQRSAMRYERTLHVPATSGQACAVLDGQIFPHAAPSLADLRIFSVGSGMVHEVPYAVTLSGAATEETQAAGVLNLKGESGKIVFDLEMPLRAYSEVRLKLDPAMVNFVATATVTGSDVLGGGRATALGSFTLFDLMGRHLSRDTTLRLAESKFRYLHVVMSVVNAPGAKGSSAARFGLGMVQGAEVTPSREEQVVYTTVAQSTSLATVGRESRAMFELPVRVPVERVSFVLAPGFKGSFSREVRVTAVSEMKGGGDVRAALPEIVRGTIVRVRTTVAGKDIRREELGVAAILGANLQGAAKVEVAIQNGGEQPLPITAVRLEMRRREVCFDAAAVGAGELRLFYGDPVLAGPVYDYERRFAVADKAAVAQLGPEMLNALYRAPVEGAQTFAERHPGLVWMILISVIGGFGRIASRFLGRAKR